MPWPEGARFARSRSSAPTPGSVWRSRRTPRS